jgi:hypothetical protein
VSGAKGLNELGMFSHEASIIAAKERAEIKMSEFFIARKFVVYGPRHSITRRCAR